LILRHINSWNSFIARIIISDLWFSIECGCSYWRVDQAGGGCYISKGAPFGFKCQCAYKGFLTCGGWNVSCEGDDSYRGFCGDCKDDQYCEAGGGDCGGH